MYQAYLAWAVAKQPICDEVASKSIRKPTRLRLGVLGATPLDEQMPHKCDDQANGSISTGQLRAFRYTLLYFRPINLVVFQGTHREN